MGKHEPLSVPEDTDTGPGPYGPLLARSVRAPRSPCGCMSTAGVIRWSVSAVRVTATER